MVLQGFCGLGLYARGHSEETADMTTPLLREGFVVNERKYPEASGRVQRSDMTNAKEAEKNSGYSKITRSR